MNGENLHGKKPHRVILRSPLLRIHYYYNKRLQVKESQYLIPTYKWTLTTIPNWTYSIVTISHFQRTTPSMWLTNSMHWSKYVTNTNLRKMLAAKFFKSSTRWRSRNSLVTKPYSVQTQQLLEEKDEPGHMTPVHNMLVKKFCFDVHQLWWPLKQSLYMFRVVRKESPNIYTWIGRKSDLKNWFS